MNRQQAITIKIILLGKRREGLSQEEIEELFQEMKWDQVGLERMWHF